jgi:hypothetical protein
MKRLLSILTLALTASLAAGQSDKAAAAPLLSGSGTATCEVNASIFGSSDCTLQAITPHGSWQQEGTGLLAGSSAQWVSYANTGIGVGAVLAPIPATTSPTPHDLGSVPWLMKVTEEFYIGANGGSIDLKIWADDSADIYLNGALVLAHNVTQDICANGVLGCQPDEFFQLVQDLNEGHYTLDFYVYQLGSSTVPNENPFGLLYAGEVLGTEEITTRVVETPAPTGLALLLPGLMLMGFRRRKA